MNSQKVVILLALQLVTQTLFAFPSFFTGKLLRTEEHLELLSNNQTVYELSLGTSALQADFARLDSGDQIVVLGEVRKSVLHVLQIESVSLQQLIGYWGTTSNTIKTYVFETFETMIVDDPFFKARQNINLASQRFRYRITPGTGENWSLHILSDSKQYLGSFQLLPNHLKLQFEDTKTAQTIYRIKLKRLSAQ